MNNLDFKKLLLGTSLLVGFAAAPAFAQDAPTEEEFATQVVTPAAQEDEGDEVVVTGSRIKRDTFSSLSPLQVIDFDEKRDLGIIDPVTILQTTESAAGQQIDSTFSGFVLDNGPGSETIDLRGLGANRTLVLVNSRRIAPSGVEGAPSTPSINLIPGSLVDRIDILLDGASSVYGSDAVAGVVNVLLKKDFEGFDVTATYNPAQDAGGKDYNLSVSARNMISVMRLNSLTVITLLVVIVTMKLTKMATFVHLAAVMSSVSLSGLMASKRFQPTNVRQQESRDVYLRIQTHLGLHIL